jgi:hypothetical protein
MKWPKPEQDEIVLARAADRLSAGDTLAEVLCQYQGAAALQ